MIAHKYVIMLKITVAHTGSALLIAIDNINTVCEIGLYEEQSIVLVLVYGVAYVLATHQAMFIEKHFSALYAITCLYIILDISAFGNSKHVRMDKMCTGSRG